MKLRREFIFIIGILYFPTWLLGVEITLTEKLKDLKQSLDEGLITQKEYTQVRASVFRHFEEKGGGGDEIEEDDGGGGGEEEEDKEEEDKEEEDKGEEDKEEEEEGSLVSNTSSFTPTTLPTVLKSPTTNIVDKQAIPTIPVAPVVVPDKTPIVKPINQPVTNKAHSFEIVTNPKTVKDSIQTRILFVGDSVMGGITTALLGMLKQEDILGVQTKIFYPVPHSKYFECTSFFRNASLIQNGNGKFGKVLFKEQNKHHDIEICSAQAGRAAGKVRAPTIDKCEALLVSENGLGNVDLGDAMHCLTLTGLIKQKDILVINTGVHHNEPDCFRDNMNHFLRWHGRGDAPFIFWRQTLPQHFPTPTGQYSKIFEKDSKGCVALKPAFIKTKSEQMQNDIAQQLISSYNKGKRIAIIKLWKQFASRWNEHNGLVENGPFEHQLDCTHWQAPARNDQAKLVLSAILRENCL